MTNNGTCGVSLYGNDASGRQSSGQGYGQWMSSSTSRPKWSETCNWNGSDCGWRGSGGSGSHCGFGSSGDHRGIGSCGIQGGFGSYGTQGGFGSCGTQGGFGSYGTQSGFGNGGSQGGFGHFGCNSGPSGFTPFGQGGYISWSQPRCGPPKCGSGWGN